jgi:hypothetical protein
MVRPNRTGLAGGFPAFCRAHQERASSGDDDNVAASENLLPMCRLEQGLRESGVATEEPVCLYLNIMIQFVLENCDADARKLLPSSRRPYMPSTVFASLGTSRRRSFKML